MFLFSILLLQAVVVVALVTVEAVALVDTEQMFLAKHLVEILLQKMLFSFR
jgi:hypothetical protein